MVTVRPARPGDLEILADFSARLGQESEDRSPDPALVRTGLAVALAGDPDAAFAGPGVARYLVAEDDGVTVGALFVTTEWSDWTAGWYWWIQGAYVVPSARGQGVFRALYDEVHRLAAAAGDVRRIRLYVHEDNPAMAVYRGLGMHEEPYRVFDAPVKGRP
jgi:GNAT superfamily N-acetyltransferase